MLLVVDPYYEEFGGKVAVLSGFDVLFVEHRVFPDGEFYFRFDRGSIGGDDVCVIVGCFPFGQNDCFVRALFFVRTLRELGAGRVVVVFPYFPYARQDKRFLSGECVSARVVADLLVSAGADLLACVDVHAPDAFSYLGDRFRNLSSRDVWVDFFRGNYSDFFLVAPDEGRLGVVRDLADALGVPYTGFRKVRDLKTGKIVGLECLDEKYLRELSSGFSTAIVFDDMISTGGTAARVVSELRKFFDGKVVAAFTHGLFLPGSVQKLIRAGVSEIVATDSVRNAYGRVSVAPLIADFLRSISRK